MALTLANLISHLNVILSGGDASPTLPGTDATDRARLIINEAGRWLVGHHPWNFRIRPPVSISLLDDTDYIELPQDFGEMVAIKPANGLSLSMTMVTMADILTKRSLDVSSSGFDYAGAIAFPSQVMRDQAPAPPRIEIWPTPNETSTGAFLVTYRARWTDLVATTDVANVPYYAEFPLTLAVRAFAGGLMEQEVVGQTGRMNRGDVPDRLEALLQSAYMRSAYYQDGLVQNSYGPMRGGAIANSMSGYYQTWDRSATVADPS